MRIYLIFSVFSPLTVREINGKYSGNSLRFITKLKDIVKVVNMSRNIYIHILWNGKRMNMIAGIEKIQTLKCIRE